ncbi:uncharacterized protein B0T23DRAFT_399007 [Neurospora hispaniola]|uniref:Uncharacterized protein n=1 Tax=Neurospora hispaniola TaxID=588809 RepID=A0AAJ0MMR0_9PEZI|nr:hypothetical protein B0T23DRAFT_399007 [Neurospora hispaniola]
MFRANEKGTRTSMVHTTPVPYQQNQELGQSHQLDYHIIVTRYAGRINTGNENAELCAVSKPDADLNNIFQNRNLLWMGRKQRPWKYSPLEGTLIPSKVDRGTLYVNTLTSVHFFSIITADSSLQKSPLAIDHMDAPTHVHGWHRNSRRSRDQRRTRRELRVCPAVSRRHLDRFIWLYEDTVWVHDADIEREILVDPGADEEEQPTVQDELWAMERHDPTAQEIAIMDTVSSTSTSAEPGTKTETTTTPSILTWTRVGSTTQPKSLIPAKPDMSIHLTPNKDQTAQEEIKAIMMERRMVTTHDNSNTDGIPSTSTAAGATYSTMNQPTTEAAGELVPAKYSSGLFSSLDWFLKNKERIGNKDAPGGSSGGVCRHGDVK